MDNPPSAVSRARCLLIVLAAWAAIYLPGLGTLEIKGEEGRRILPAVTMLETGDFIVPRVGSDAYFAKPPLVNWLVAGSFSLFGVRNEWTARLPSALCVLAVAVAFVTAGRGALGSTGALGGALVWLTNFGILEKGRLIEIEALYVSLTGIAVILWLSWWSDRRSPWLTWTMPWIFLGLGLLAKGPLHLVFFYAVVAGVLWWNGELRRLFKLPHLSGICVMLLIFAAWAVPCLLIVNQEHVADTWSRQFSGRLSGEDFQLSGWLMNIPRGLGYFLPWTVLLLFFKRTQWDDRRRAATARGLFWGIGVSFFAVSLLPGSLARYTMPLLAPAAWLVAMMLTAAEFRLPQWLQLKKPVAFPQTLRPVIWFTLLCAGTIALYAFGAMPFLKKREKVRNIARQINGVLPPAQPLYAIDPDYQPYLFYVREPIVYLPRIEDVPQDARYLLVQRSKLGEATDPLRWQPRSARPVLKVKDYRNKEAAIIAIEPAG